MNLRDALALVKLPPAAKQAKKTRLLRAMGKVSRHHPEHKAAFDRLRSQVPKKFKGGWHYCHTIYKQGRWVHVFERRMDSPEDDWIKTMRCECGDEMFDEIMAVIAYDTDKDGIRCCTAMRCVPKNGIVDIWPAGSAGYRSVVSRIKKLQTRRVRAMKSEHRRN